MWPGNKIWFFLSLSCCLPGLMSHSTTVSLKASKIFALIRALYVIPLCFHGILSFYLWHLSKYTLSPSRQVCRSLSLYCWPELLQTSFEAPRINLGVCASKHTSYFSLSSFSTLVQPLFIYLYACSKIILKIWKTISLTVDWWQVDSFLL